MEKYECLKLENQLCFSLYALSREIIRLYKPFLDKYNLTYTQYLTLLVLWENESMNVKEIGKELHLDSGTLTPVIKKLETMNLISKKRASSDDRVVIVELTEKGYHLKDKIKDIPHLISCEIGISSKERSELKVPIEKLLVRLMK
ncbi:MarR family winged helix-turn-helix transcriptional regulator [Proteocatella sphenisci]|uniref:MarR family winged helix-turn-helix transcriptional regulator n=1 Tax=Proteocatella sphenisci TaxID=181070 RepID=UPI00048BABFA|nr:MarR family transcriptional regulator [Proteocatella sphenisci]